MARVGASGTGGASGSPQATPVYVYNEVTNVNPGIETTIATYTAVAGVACSLQSISSSSTNVTIFLVYINSNVVDKQYGSYTQYNVFFQYFTGNTTAPGIPLNTGDVVKVTAIQNQTSTANFNAVIQILEVET
jgi:hypothetical protein